MTARPLAPTVGATYTMVMGGENRTSPRVAVSIHMDCADARDGTLHIQDLSIGGFLAKGKIAAAVGSTISGKIHVFPSSGERDVPLLGMIMRVRQEDDDAVLGVRIVGFGSLDENASYLVFVSELSTD